MHDVERLERALAEARNRGFQIRSEWLGGAGCGACEVRGQRLLFVDLALDPREQLSQILEALTSIEGQAQPVMVAGNGQAAADLWPAQKAIR